MNTNLNKQSFAQVILDDTTPVKSGYLDDFKLLDYDRPPGMRLLSNLELLKNQRSALSWTIGSFCFGAIAAGAAAKGLGGSLTFGNIASTAFSVVATGGAAYAGDTSLKVYKGYAKEILYRLSKRMGRPSSPPPAPLEMRRSPPSPPSAPLTVTLPSGDTPPQVRQLRL